MVHSTTDYACNKGRETDWRKFCLAHGLGDGGEDGDFVFVGEIIEERIVLEMDFLKEFLETNPGAILLR